MGERLNPNQISASQLYQDCMSNDHQTRNQGYENLWRYLYKSASYLANNADHVQDLAQISLEKVCRKIDQVQSPDAFKSWTRRILRNEFINWLRREPDHIEISPDVHDKIQSKKVESSIEALDISIDHLFHASQSKKAKWAWIGRYHYDLQDKELADVENLLCKKNTVRESTFYVARSKTKKQWIEMKLMDILIEAKFQPIDPADPNVTLQHLLQQLMVAENWHLLYNAPLNEGSRWAWIGRHIYEMSDKDLVRVENLLCETSIGSKIMKARRKRTREVLKAYLKKISGKV